MAQAISNRQVIFISFDMQRISPRFNYRTDNNWFLGIIPVQPLSALIRLGSDAYSYYWFQTLGDCWFFARRLSVRLTEIASQANNSTKYSAKSGFITSICQNTSSTINLSSPWLDLWHLIKSTEGVHLQGGTGRSCLLWPEYTLLHKTAAFW